MDPSVSVMVDIHNTIVNNCFSYWGSDRLKAEWLPRLTTDCLGAFCLSEATSGSDAFALRATATRDGGDFVLEGEKMWIPNPNPTLFPTLTPTLTPTPTLTLTPTPTLALPLTPTPTLNQARRCGSPTRRRQGSSW